MAPAADQADEALVTPFIAAGSSDSNLAAWAVLAVVLWAGWYLLVCAAYPWRACRWCEGGKKRDSSRKHWRDCRHCRGTGRRARIGRQFWTRLGRRPRGRG